MNHNYLRYRIATAAREIVYFPLDAVDLVAGYRPPGRRIFVGDGSWRGVGSEFLRIFRSEANLLPHEHVLDVGCGIGRIAAGLTGYLRPPGSYLGFDIVRDGVAWCRKHILSRHAHFSFEHANIFNGHYNPSGTVRPSEYAFPCDDSSKDFVFLTSVFTHMLPADMDRYVREIARVLRPGGRCLGTLFLLNEQTLHGIRTGKSVFPFVPHVESLFVVHPSNPEAAIAYPEESVRSILKANRLIIQEPVRYGSWSGARRHLSFQDIIIATKE